MKTNEKNKNYKKRVLYDANGRIIAVWRKYKEYAAITTSVDSWSYPDNKPIDEGFFSNNWVKWDGCSHFYFTGDSSVVEQDSYYHICGVDFYIKHMQLLWFSLKCWSFEHENFDELEELFELDKNNLFTNLSIKTVEWSEKDDYMLIRFTEDSNEND